MKLTIIAATGGVGQQLLEQALDAGHDVTAGVRNPGKLSRKVHAVTTDVTAPDPAALASAIAGADAVLSGLGPHSNADAGIAQRGTRAVVEAMQATGVRRIVVVSAGPVSTVASPGRPNPPKHDPGDGFFMRYLFSKIASARFGKVYVDLARMVAQGRREGRVSQRYRVQAQRISRRSTMIAWANAKNASMTGSRRSVFQTSFLNWLPQAWVRSTGHRWLACTGAGLPRSAIWPVMPCSASSARVLPLS